MNGASAAFRGVPFVTGTSRAESRSRSDQIAFTQRSNGVEHGQETDEASQADFGVKLLKQLRRGPLADFLMSPAGQAVVAGAVTSLGAALAGASLGNRPLETLREAGEGAADNAKSAAASVETGAANLYHALGEAAQHFIGSIGNESKRAASGKKAKRQGADGRVQH